MVFGLVTLVDDSQAVVRYTQGHGGLYLTTSSFFDGEPVEVVQYFILMDFRRRITWPSALAFAALQVCEFAPARQAQAAEVPHVTIEAESVVAGLRVLVGNPHGSYQVLLWRAERFLSDRLKGEGLEQIRAEFEKAGAEKVAEWGDESVDHTLRYRIQKNVMKSRVGRSYDLLVEFSCFKNGQVDMRPVLLVRFDAPFSTVAARRDYQKGTLLDRVFGIHDLIGEAKKKPWLESIEINAGRVGYFSSPGGYGFQVIVKLTNGRSGAASEEHSAEFMVCSGLEPTDMQRVTGGAFVARDTLRSDVFFDTRGLPVVFAN